MRDTSLRISAIALALSINLSCVAQGGSPVAEETTSPTRPAGEPLPLRERGARAARRAALQSIYFFAYNDSAGALPSDVRPVVLSEAAGILSADRSPGWQNRRLRAISVLAASGPDEDKARALSILGDGFLPAAISPAASSPQDDDQRARFEARVYRRLAGLTAEGDCTLSPVTATFEGNDSGEVEAATVVIDVGLSVDELRAIIDAQNWEQCASFFERTDIVLDSPEDYPADPAAPKPGSTYDDSLLYEEFVFEFVVKWLTLRNLLSVSASGDPSPSHHVMYTLQKSLDAKFPWVTRDGGVVIDGGFIKAEPITSPLYKTRVTVRKELRFGGFWSTAIMNAWRKPMFRLLADEVREAICCPTAP